MGNPLPPVSAAQQGVANAAGSAAAGAAVATGSTLAAAAASAGITMAVQLGAAGVSWLWKKAFPPPPPEAPKRSEVVKSVRTAARFVHGERVKTAGKLVYRTVVPAPPKREVTDPDAPRFPFADRNRLVGYDFNHYRQIFVVSEGSLSDLYEIEIEKHGLIPLEKVTENGNTYYEPPEGAGFDLPPDDVTTHGFPQKRIVRCWLANAGDGSDLARFDLDAVNAAPGVEIEYERIVAGGTEWQPKPDQSTKKWRTYTLLCQEGEEEGADGLCYPAGRPTGPPQDATDPDWNTGTQPSRKLILASGDYDRLPAPWTDKHQLKGKTSIVVDLFAPFHQVVDEEGSIDTSDDFFTSIPDIKFVVGGMKITWPGQTAPAATANPAAIQWWYDTVRLGIPEDRFDLAAFAECLADCDRMISIPDGAVPDDLAELKSMGLTAFKAYQYHGVIQSGEEPEVVRDRLEMARDGGTYRTHEGLFAYRAGKVTEPVLALDREDFARLGKCKPFQSLDGRVNVLTALMEQSAWEGYNQATLTIDDPAALARDIRERPWEMQFEGQNNPLQAAWLATAFMVRERETFWLEGTIRQQPGMAQARLLPRDTIFISSIDSHHIINRWFIVERSVPLPHGQQKVVLRLHQYDPYRPSLRLPEARTRGLAAVRTRPPDVTGLSAEIFASGNRGGVDINMDMSVDPQDAFVREFGTRHLGYGQVMDSAELVLDGSDLDTASRIEAYFDTAELVCEGNELTELAQFASLLDTGELVCEANEFVTGGVLDWFDETPDIDTGLLFKATGLTVYYTQTARRATIPSQVVPNSRDFTFTGNEGNKEGFWLYHPDLAAQTNDTGILGTNVKFERIGAESRGSWTDVGTGRGGRARLRVDFEKEDAADARTDLTAAQRAAYRFVFVDRATDTHRVRTIPVADTAEPYVWPDNVDLRNFLAAARQAGRTIDLYVIDTRAKFTGPDAFRHHGFTGRVVTYDPSELVCEANELEVGTVTYRLSDPLLQPSFASGLLWRARTFKFSLYDSRYVGNLRHWGWQGGSASTLYTSATGSIAGAGPFVFRDAQAQDRGTTRRFGSVDFILPTGHGLTTSDVQDWAVVFVQTAFGTLRDFALGSSNCTIAVTGNVVRFTARPGARGPGTELGSEDLRRWLWERVQLYRSPIASFQYARNPTRTYFLRGRDQTLEAMCLVDTTNSDVNLTRQPFTAAGQ